LSAGEERRFSVDEAQALLDSTVRELAERMVVMRKEWRPLQARWQKVVMAVAGNGGGMPARDTEALRERLEELTADLNEVIEEITALGVQVKDVDRGLLDFPSTVEGQEALLCWLVGEERIAYWHPPEDGYAGRRPL
jgi:hypothetical protein